MDRPQVVYRMSRNTYRVLLNELRNRKNILEYLNSLGFYGKVVRIVVE